MANTKRIIVMNVNIIGKLGTMQNPMFPKGKEYIYSQAPEDVKFWADNDSILGNTPICSFLDSSGNKKTICKGLTDKGDRCRSTNIVTEDGYCPKHASESEAKKAKDKARAEEREQKVKEDEKKRQMDAYEEEFDCSQEKTTEDMEETVEIKDIEDTSGENKDIEDTSGENLESDNFK